ncbi:MAG: hypothetical protein H7X85_11295 [Thermoanaerobaculia bacterium]|nr:hypothetical protein [Thermoanaerobaculia bacterium]
MTDKPFDDDSVEALRRFARPTREGFRESDSLLCRHLQARGRYVSDLPAEGSPARATATAYWCLRTMRPQGPDGAIALPEDCTDERICFEPTIGPDVEA